MNDEIETKRCATCVDLKEDGTCTVLANRVDVGSMPGNTLPSFHIRPHADFGCRFWRGGPTDQDALLAIEAWRVAQNNRNDPLVDK